MTSLLRECPDCFWVCFKMLVITYKALQGIWPDWGTTCPWFLSSFLCWQSWRLRSPWLNSIIYQDLGSVPFLSQCLFLEWDPLKWSPHPRHLFVFHKAWRIVFSPRLRAKMDPCWVYALFPFCLYVGLLFCFLLVFMVLCCKLPTVHCRWVGPKLKQMS